MKRQNKETAFLLVVTTVLAIVITRAYADPMADLFVPEVKAEQSQQK